MKDKSKSPMKAIMIFLGVVLVCVISFLASLSADDENNNKNYSAPGSSEDVSAIIERAEAESAAVKKDEMKDPVEIGIDKYLELYKGSEKSLILIARPTCGYCQIAKPIIQNLAHEYDITVNYLNTDELSESEHTKLIQSDEYFAEGYGTPILLVVMDGKIVDKVDGLTDKEHYKEFMSQHGFIN